MKETAPIRASNDDLIRPSVGELDARDRSRTEQVVCGVELAGDPDGEHLPSVPIPHCPSCRCGMRDAAGIIGDPLYRPAASVTTERSRNERA